jgi:uncharacterized repeat protein (TIGR02543 family)
MNTAMHGLGRKLVLVLTAALALAACDMEPDEDSYYDSSNNDTDSEETYTLSFDSRGGSPVAPLQKVKLGATVTLPDPPLRGGYVFQGWYYDNYTFKVPFTSSTPVTKEYGTYDGSLKVFATWTGDTVYTEGVLPEGSLNDKLRILADRADRNIIYTISISEDTTCSYWDIVTRGINVIIKIRSADPQSPKKISPATANALFSINGSVTVVLENIIIQGRADNTSSLIIVNDGALEVLGGAKITGNRVNGIGGGVVVHAYGNLILDGGEISGNASTSWGGGVLVMEGAFTMKSGLIRGNTAGTAESTWGQAWGGGVGVDQGKFLMTGGEISGNTAVVGGGVGIYGTGFNFLTEQFEKKPPFGSTSSGVIYGADGPEGMKNIATGVNTKAGYKCAAVAYHDGQPYGDISYRMNTLDTYTGITTDHTRNDTIIDNLYAAWDETIREYNL